MALSVVVLAAGQGTRMASRHPKVLHPLGERSMLGHVLGTSAALNPQGLYSVIGHGASEVQAAFEGAELNWVHQAEQLGTGHAVHQALPAIADDHQVLVLYADVPLVRPATLKRLLSACGDDRVGMLTLTMDEPKGYGRILRDAANQAIGIVEEKDASAEQRAIREVNTGLMAVPARYLKRWLPALSSDNVQSEYYLTDIVAMAAAEGIAIETVGPEASWEVQGVNDRVQLAELERVLQRNRAEALMRAGATVKDPNRLEVRGDVRVEADVTLDVGVILEGEVRLGEGCVIGPYCHLKDVTLGAGVRVQDHTVVEGAEVAAGAELGPFARVRPGCEIGEGARVGNFVEIKKSRLGRASKANHLAYVGDTEVGENANVGAGTITCNYDGAHKHKTAIGDGAFIGSNASLVAPVSIGRGATVGAGSTVTRDAPDASLVVARARPRIIENWAKGSADAEQRPQAASEASNQAHSAARGTGGGSEPNN